MSLSHPLLLLLAGTWLASWLVPLPAPPEDTADRWYGLMLATGASGLLLAALLAGTGNWFGAARIGAVALEIWLVMFWIARNDDRPLEPAVADGPVDDGPGGGGGGRGPGGRPVSPGPRGGGIDWDAFDHLREQWQRRPAPQPVEV